MNGFVESISGFWRARATRQRIQILIALLLVALGLVYLTLIAPALAGRAAYSKSLPVLRQQAAEMDSLSKQAMNLSKATAPQIEIISKEVLEAALARKGLKPTNVSVTGEVANVKLSLVSFTSVMEWIDEVQRSLRLTVIDANITGLPQTDTVNVTMSFRQQKSEQ